MRTNVVIAIGLVVVAVVFAALAIFYWTVKTSFLASSNGHHPKHAIVFTVLALLALVAANFARRAGVSRA